MKNKKVILVILVVVVSGLLCAYSFAPSIRLAFGEKTTTFWYNNATSRNGKLLITVNYDSNGAFFEIGKEMVVSTDRNFTNPLKLVKCDAKEGSYLYEYSVKDFENIDTVYIKPPVLYMPTSIHTVSIPLRIGEVAEMVKDEASTKAKSNEWFQIENIESGDREEAGYPVKVTVKGLMNDLPRFPRIKTEGNEIGGISALTFNEDDEFENGEWLFYLEANSIEQLQEIIEDSTIEISDSLVKVAVDSVECSSNIALSIVE